MAFDFKKSLIKVQGGQQYLPVSARIVWFRQERPDWGIHTEPLEINHEKQYAIFRASIYNAEGKLMATGTKKEDVKGFGDFIEKAETGSVGRALALCGFGTQFAPELDETRGGRFADSPQPMGGNRYGGGGGNAGGAGRYGNAPQNNNAPQNGGGGDGARFSPPREVSAPPAESRPAEARPMPPPARAEAPRPEPARPAPAPAHDDGEDDFEALIGAGGLRDATEDDPFGDDEPADAKPAARVAAPTAAKTDGGAGAGPNGTPACVGCSKALTKAQQELSIRNYGEALCPGCQKDKSRRPALAER